MKKVYTILLGGDQPPQIEAESAEDAIIILREALKAQGVYLPVPMTVTVIADDFEAEVTA